MDYRAQDTAEQQAHVIQRLWETQTMVINIQPWFGTEKLLPKEPKRNEAPIRRQARTYGLGYQSGGPHSC